MTLGQLPTPSSSELLVWLGCAAAVIGGLAAIVMLFNAAMDAKDKIAGKKQKSHTTISPQPLEITGEVKVEPKFRRFSQDTCDAKHSEVTRRLDSHDAEIGKIWMTLREEDALTRNALSQAVRDFDQTVSRIDGTLSQIDKTHQMIIERLINRS